MTIEEDAHGRHVGVACLQSSPAIPPPRPATPPPRPASAPQPLGLPMMLVGQSAARAPMYAMRGDRLLRGLIELAATFLVCRSAGRGCM